MYKLTYWVIKHLIFKVKHLIMDRHIWLKLIKTSHSLTQVWIELCNKIKAPKQYLKVNHIYFKNCLTRTVYQEFWEFFWDITHISSTLGIFAIIFSIINVISTFLGNGRL